MVEFKRHPRFLIVEAWEDGKKKGNIWSMGDYIELESFTLAEDQIEYLRKKYVDVQEVSSLLEYERNCSFNLPVMVCNQFWMWLINKCTEPRDEDSVDVDDDLELLSSIVDSMVKQKKEQIGLCVEPKEISAIRDNIEKKLIVN